jgi:hypothetical protein
LLPGWLLSLLLSTGKQALSFGRFDANAVLFTVLLNKLAQKLQKWPNVQVFRIFTN